MEQFDSSVEESSKVSEQQQRNDEQQCPSCAAELTETSVWMNAASETDCMYDQNTVTCHNCPHCYFRIQKITEQYFITYLFQNHTVYVVL